MEDLSWLWHSLLARVIWGLLATGGSAVLAILRAKKPTLAAPILYGLGGLACFSVIFFAATGHSFLTPAPTDANNIEANVKKWSADFGFGVQSVPSQVAASYDFAYRLSLPSGDAIVVGVDRSKPGYLQIQGSLAVSPEHTAILEKLTPIQAQEVWSEAETELLRNDYSFLGQGVDPIHTQGLMMGKGVVFSGLTEPAFGQAIDNLEETRLLVRNQFVASLQRISGTIVH